VRGDTRHGMGLQHFSWLASFLGNWLGSLISEREWWFSNQREDYFCLVTFMNVLEYPFSVTDLGSWERMDAKL